MKFPHLEIVVVAFLVVSVAAKPSAFKDCGSTGAKIAAVDITPCDTVPESEACGVKAKQNASISISFRGLADAASLQAVAYGTIGPLRVKYPLPQPDACVDSNLTCPLTPNKDYSYSTSLLLPPIPKQVGVAVEMDLMLDDDKYLCVMFPLVVQPSDNLLRFMKNILSS